VDPLTLFGVLAALALLLVGVVMEGTNPAALIAPPAFLIVIVPTVLVSVAGFMKKDVSTIVAGFKRALTGKAESPAASIEIVVDFAARARKEGLLSLEEPARELDDEFLRNGINLAVDGTDPEELRQILEAEVLAKRNRDKVAAKFFTDMGGFAPTLGIVGAITGLIHVLGNLSDPAAAGAGIAGAFVATFYGVAFANMVFLPIGNKLKRLADADAQLMELLLEGILSIQSGSNPRVLEQKLMSFLPDKDRQAIERDRAA
jgi:chemotaxis protein MotA